MSTGLIVGLVIGGIVLVLLVAFIGIYNSLSRMDERINEAWSDITVQLKRRSDLIPNLVETVKGYAKHEEGAIKAVSEARAKMMGARTVAETAQAEQGFMGALSRIMAVTESYPQLKADENFRQLTAELTDTEDKIQAARRFYNAGVKSLNAKIRTFPTNLVNKMVGHFKKREYFEVADSERERIEKAPEVKF